ncbi:hypothetical protein CJF31_00006102 [Rutstroemia sp. NJR-2017a BVV2]|nr:hypothetical protein CJF31_00010228 [Rutstroemia sp. NJR-2017a BVV2]PQE25219.1 hypothetical protein CJF31_00006102 [Rutstroemia sp. NJR-2017a BVV2]
MVLGGYEWESQAKAHQSPVVAVMGTGVGKTLLFQLPAKNMSSGTTIVISPLVSLQEHIVERYQQVGISYIKWDPRQYHSASQMVIVTPEAVVSKMFGTFLDRLQRLHLLERFVFDKCHTVLDNTAEFRPKIRQVGELMEQGMQMIIIYNSSIITIQEVSRILRYHIYYHDVGEAAIKDKIRKTNRQVVVATNAFGLGIDRPDIRVVVHIGPIYQMRNYSQESRRTGRDGQRSEAIIMMPVGRQEALQKV